MALEDDFRAAIDKNISAEIGTALKERLEQAESDATNLVGARSQIKDLQLEVEKHQKMDHDWSRLEERRQGIDAKERELELKEAILNVTEAAALKNRNDLMLVVTQVFKGPASKQAFELYGNLSGLMTDHGISSSPSASLSGSVGED